MRKIARIRKATLAGKRSAVIGYLEYADGRGVSSQCPRSPREEAGPLKGSPVSVRLRPGVLIDRVRRNQSRETCTVQISIANAASAETMVPADRPKADPRHKWFIPLNHDISVLYTVGNMLGGNCGRGRTGNDRGTRVRAGRHRTDRTGPGRRAPTGAERVRLTSAAHPGARAGRARSDGHAVSAPGGTGAVA